jgi:alkanesulfonate monooxygenase SsuD/methylene tetrahydromethanopterin reductase-like flavin-dependent oxidoreductase (luciferase family)
MSEVEFGWRLPAFPVDGSRGAEFVQQIVENLTQVQGRFQSAWVADHFIPWANFQSDETDTLECLTAVNYMAGAFPLLDFGTIVLCQSYRNPALLAKMAATLQLLSGGRFILGIGAGWKADEYRAYNYDYPKPAVRIGQLEDTVEIIKRLWSSTPATYEGKYYSIENAYCEPKPDPRPPIMIGGGGEQLTLRVVAKHADWWNFPGSTLENYTHKLDVLRQHCDAVGRDYDEIRKTWACEQVAVAATEEEARRMATASPFSGNNLLVGTPEQVAEGLRTFTNVGVTYFMLRFCDFPGTEGVLRFAEEVMPLVRQG